MATTGGPGGGDDPFDHFKRFWSGCRNQPTLTWNPKRIKALPGGRRSVAVLMLWHANSNVLLAHVIRYSRTPVGIVGLTLVVGVAGWYGQNRQSPALQRAEQEAAQVRAELQRQRDEVARLNAELEKEKSHWANFKKWFD